MAEDNANNIPAALASSHRDRNARFQAGDHDSSRMLRTLITYQLGNFTRKWPEFWVESPTLGASEPQTHDRSSPFAQCRVG